MFYWWNRSSYPTGSKLKHCLQNAESHLIIFQGIWNRLFIVNWLILLPWPAFPCIGFASAFAYIGSAWFPNGTADSKGLVLESSTLTYSDFNGPCTYFIDKAFNFASLCLRINSYYLHHSYLFMRESASILHSLLLLLLPFCSLDFEKVMLDFSIRDLRERMNTCLGIYTIHVNQNVCILLSCNFGELHFNFLLSVGFCFSFGFIHSYYFNLG